jgi:RNA polymerase sigma-70 factor (ECF subfamily)
MNLAAAALARLPSEQREVLTLVAWEGLDAGEIAQVCGCSRNAARIRIHRARRRFVRELTRLGGSVKQNAVGGHVSEAYE